MVAEHSIMVQSGRGIQYKFDIHRKYTVIRGDSATGKTTLVRMIEDAAVRKTADISCDVPCVVLPDMNWEINLDAFSESIVFIDEDHPALTAGKKVAEKMFVSDNCFVIISRDKMPWIPYSYKEIYEIRSSGKFHRLERMYEDMEEFHENEGYVTEDEAAGFEFYQKWFGSNVKTSHGNSSLSKYAKSGNTLIGDGAAIGPYMYDLMLGEAKLFLPESFEWLLLHSPIFEKDKEVQERLTHTSEYVSTKYQSWEEYFTEFLLNISHGKEYQYSKKKLNNCYVDECCRKNTFCDGFTKKEKRILKMSEGTK